MAKMEDRVLEEGIDFFNVIEGVGLTTCDWNKAYLDTGCTNHLCFAAKHLTSVHDRGVVICQHCNTGTDLTGKAGF